MKISKLIEYMIFIFIISSLLIPAAFLNKAVFAIIVFLFVFQFAKVKNARFITLAPIIILIVYIYGYIRSFASHSDQALALQFMIFTVILFLIYPIVENDVDLERIVKVCGVVLSIISLLLYIIFVKKINFIGSDSIFSFFEKYGLLAMGYRGFFGESKLFVHFGSVPFLYLPGCLYFDEYLKTRSKTILVILGIILTAMVLSTSRALVLGFMLGAVVLVVRRMKGYDKALLLIALVVVSTLALAYMLFNSSMFDASENSNRIKIGDAKSFLDNINLVNLLIGDGLGSYYFAGGRGGLRAHTENTLLDTVRYFGVILTFIIYITLTVPTTNISRIRENVDKLLIFAIYILMSITNPILLNSVGGIIILWYWRSVYTSTIETEDINEFNEYSKAI